MHGEGVVKRFALAERDLLGSGGESRVYALDNDHILRVYSAGIDTAYVERLRAFYAAAGARELPFELPAVEEVGTLDTVLYAIETRIHGTSLTQYLLTAGGAARARSLENYFAAAGHIQKIPIEVEEFGELFISEPIRRPEWPAFLLARARRALQAGYPDISAEVPGLDRVVASWEAGLRRLHDVSSPKLAHGDYFPGNVLVDARGEITAVIDFSPMTVAGDPRLDPVCALIFLEVDDGYQPADSDTGLRLLEARYGSAILDVVDVYRTYYSLYFSSCKDSHPSLYAWCVANLSRAPQRLAGNSDLRLGT